MLTYERKESSGTAWDLQLLKSWPDTDTKLSVQALVRQQKRSGYLILDPLKKFLEELVKMAQQQIVKGLQAGGVVRNVKPVVAAHHMIYKVLLEGTTLPTDWIDQMA